MARTRLKGNKKMKLESKNILTELSKHPEGTFLSLIDFNSKSFGACSISGESPVWEMHPDTDEMFYVLEGELEIVLLLESGESKVTIESGSVFVIPQSIWHKPMAPNGVKFMHFTPGQSLHSDADDPRK